MDCPIVSHIPKATVRFGDTQTISGELELTDVVIFEGGVLGKQFGDRFWFPSWRIKSVWIPETSEPF